MNIKITTVRIWPRLVLQNLCHSWHAIFSKMRNPRILQLSLIHFLCMMWSLLWIFSSKIRSQWSAVLVFDLERIVFTRSWNGMCRILLSFWRATKFPDSNVSLDLRWHFVGVLLTRHWYRTLVRCQFAHRVDFIAKGLFDVGPTPLTQQAPHMPMICQLFYYLVLLLLTIHSIRMLEWLSVGMYSRELALDIKISQCMFKRTKQLIVRGFT